jgi:hypothetical protein
MLIICNGAFKSGSSWLHAILVELSIVKKLNLQKVPEKYTNDINSPTTIIESQIENFLLTEDFDLNNYLTKSHFFKKKTLRKKYSNSVKILFIERDMRDAIVSHYFHIINKYKYKLNFSFYYFFIGRYKAFEISLFNYRCKKFRGEENFFHFSDLISDFEITVREIALSLGITEISDQEVKQIKEQTTLDKLREKMKKGNLSYRPANRAYNWRLFREGKVGGWKEYFNTFQMNDIQRIENGRFSIFSVIVYFFIFTLRRVIFRIE